jgi:hypothetical protein
MKTVTAELVETGENRDARGRRVMRVEAREALLAAYASSGMTQRAQGGQSPSPKGRTAAAVRPRGPRTQSVRHVGEQIRPFHAAVLSLQLWKRGLAFSPQIPRFLPSLRSRPADDHRIG